MKYRVGIDLGGTNIAAGIVDESVVIVSKGSVPTNQKGSSEEIISDIVQLVLQLLEERDLTMDEVQSIGIGVPGTANKENGFIEYANNLPFSHVPFARLLEEKLHKKTFFDNDGNAAAWGEFIAGAGRGKDCDSLIAVTLGTGVGGGIIVNRSIYRGTNYSAAEFGHMVIDYRGIPCNCGRIGCYEVYASATALINQAREAMNRNKNSALWKLCGEDISQVDGKIIFEGAHLKDITASLVVKNYIDYLAVGITNMINLFQPDILCIGGGISAAGSLFLEPLKNAVFSQVYSSTSQKQTDLVIAELGNDAGIIGAAFLEC